jgi:hypothetical protein
MIPRVLQAISNHSYCLPTLKDKKETAAVGHHSRHGEYVLVEIPHTLNVIKHELEQLNKSADRTAFALHGQRMTCDPCRGVDGSPRCVETCTDAVLCAMGYNSQPVPSQPVEQKQHVRPRKESRERVADNRKLEEMPRDLIVAPPMRVCVNVLCEKRCDCLTRCMLKEARKRGGRTLAQRWCPRDPTQQGAVDAAVWPTACLSRGVPVRYKRTVPAVVRFGQ